MQIESICCSSDGEFALIQCSDKAVLLYSPTDLFACGRTPDETYGAPRRTSFLSLWFQGNDQFLIHLSLVYNGAVELSSSHNSANDEDYSNPSSEAIPSASRLRVCLAWVPSFYNSDKSGESAVTDMCYPMLIFLYNHLDGQCRE
jgi:hypothetical protein